MATCLDDLSRLQSQLALPNTTRQILNPSYLPLLRCQPGTDPGRYPSGSVRYWIPNGMGSFDSASMGDPFKDREIEGRQPYIRSVEVNHFYPSVVCTTKKHMEPAHRSSTSPAKNARLCVQEDEQI